MLVGDGSPLVAMCYSGRKLKVPYIWNNALDLLQVTCVAIILSYKLN